LLYSESSPPTNRLITSNSALWNITETWNLGELFNTPDISAVIQEIVNLPDWNLGQPISLIIKNAGSTDVRRVIGFERADIDPELETAQLFITYNTNPTSTPTVLPPNVTPLPSSTPIVIQPTFTPLPVTPEPTNLPPPEYCGICDWGCQFNSVQRLSSTPGFYGTSTPYATTPEVSSLRIAEAVDLTTLLYRVRDEILATTPEGERLTDIYYTYIPSIIQVLIAHPELSDSSMATLRLFAPSLEALVDGNGDTVTVTAEQVQGLQSFIDTLVQYGDAELQSVILSELESHLLENMVGITLSEAWSQINGYEFEWLPPIGNLNPYSAQQKSTIPVKFTITDFDGSFVVDESVTLQVLNANGNVVVGPIPVSNNPNNGIKIQASQYHYNLKTKDLPADSYTLQITYNSSIGVQTEIRSIILTTKK